MNYYEKEKPSGLLNEYLIKIEKQIPNIIKQMEGQSNKKNKYDDYGYKMPYYSPKKPKYDACEKYDHYDTKPKYDACGKNNHYNTKSKYNYYDTKPKYDDCGKYDYYNTQPKYDTCGKYDYHVTKPKYDDSGKCDYYDTKQKYDACGKYDYHVTKPKYDDYIYNKKFPYDNNNEKYCYSTKLNHNNFCHKKHEHPIKSYDFYQKVMKHKIPCQPHNVKINSKYSKPYAVNLFSIDEGFCKGTMIKDRHISKKCYDTPIITTEIGKEKTLFDEINITLLFMK